MTETASEESERCTSSDYESDTEGSLADFIEHDEDEYVDDDDEELYNSESASTSSENMSVDDSGGHDDDDNGGNNNSEDGEHGCGDAQQETCTDEDAEIVRGYTANMEQQGLQMIQGVRRSMRVNKGVAPQRYVDEDYLSLMLSDVDVSSLDGQSDQSVT